MRLLLDTHILLWAISAPERLRAPARAAILDTDNDVLFSAVSIWEIAIKAALRRTDFEAHPDVVLAEAADLGFLELQVTAKTAATVADLPLIHRDPFDRILIAQAIAEPALFYTADTRLAAYSDLVRRVPAR
jgi:PIN domain nuclease of toxin-antitoxin system